MKKFVMALIALSALVSFNAQAGFLFIYDFTADDGYWVADQDPGGYSYEGFEVLADENSNVGAVTSTYEPEGSGAIQFLGATSDGSGAWPESHLNILSSGSTDYFAIWFDNGPALDPYVLETGELTLELDGGDAGDGGLDWGVCLSGNAFSCLYALLGGSDTGAYISQGIDGITNYTVYVDEQFDGEEYLVGTYAFIRNSGTYSIDVNVERVPAPAPLFLIGAALLSFGAARRHSKNS